MQQTRKHPLYKVFLLVYQFSKTLPDSAKESTVQDYQFLQPYWPRVALQAAILGVRVETASSFGEETRIVCSAIWSKDFPNDVHTLAPVADTHILTQAIMVLHHVQLPYRRTSA